MITRDLLKNEIDKVQDDYLELLYNVIRAFELKKSKNNNWITWVNQMYGCFNEDPIQRFPQGNFENREILL
ncbi:MAG: hypothetical protein H7A23_18120 [Leptospiraceae bacterium]|nr:hypothetical protein [Leptospiraceae bacterium]MCP5496466.1 hypothetical protein [Leptospiraceae bacterium]